MPMLADFVVETANNPGTGTTVNLIGATTGPFTTFATRFTTGSQVFYTINDGGALAETGVGTFTAGSPNTLSRDTVLSNTAGTVARVNFLGVVYVYCSMPAARSVYLDNTNTVNLTGGITVSGHDSGGLDYRITQGNFGAGLRNDGASAYLLQTANGQQTGTFNAFRPYAWNLSTGAVTIDGTGVGSTFGGNVNMPRIIVTGSATPSSIGFTSSDALVLNQSGSTAASGLRVNVSTVSGNLAFWQFAGGTVGSITTNGASSSYNTTSDATLKIDDGLIENSEATRILLSLKPRWFRWKSTPDVESEPGFFAQQVHRIFPWAVTKGRGRGKKRMPWQMDNSKLVPLLVAALQGALTRIDALEKGR